MILYSNRLGGFGEFDLWVATRETTRDAWSRPVNLGATVNSGAEERGPALSLDGTTLYFSSNRPGGYGMQDLYVMTRTTAKLTVTPTVIPVGGKVTANWLGIATPSLTDWIGLYVPGSANADFLDWIYVSCSRIPGDPQAEGSCPFFVPPSVSPGDYELRLFANDGFTLLAISNTLKVE
jgi:hypothetical protein